MSRLIETTDARRVALAAVALGCVLAYSRAFAAGFAGALPMCAQPQMADFSFACSVARVATIAVVVALGCIWRVSPGRVAPVCAGVLMAVCGIVLAGGQDVYEGMPFALAAGAASGLAMLVMLMLLSSLRIRGIVAAAFGGLLVGGLLIMGLMRAGAVGATVIFVTSGLFAGILFPAIDPSARAWRADGLPSVGQLAAFPWFAAAAFAISGLLAAVFYGAASALGWNPSGRMNAPLFVLAIAATLGCTAYIALQGEEAADAAWIPLFVLLLAAMALACFDDAEVNPSVMALLFAAVFSYHFLRWLVFPTLVSFSDMPRMFTCGVVLVATSSFIGVGWGASMAGSFPEGLRDQGGFVACIAIMLLVVFTAALFVNRMRLDAARMQLDTAGSRADALEGQVEALRVRLRELEQEPPAPAEASLELRCAALAQEGGLTAREGEILLLTARGHSSTFIAEQLFISASTVRFHQQNIYRKLDVHSRQELLALVNAHLSK